MAAVGEALVSSVAALASAGATRHVVAAALAAGLRVIASAQHPRSSEVLSCEEDIEARLKALRVVLEAQLAASRQGRAQHSASGLVSTDANVMANAARHEFSKPFVDLTPAGARQLQRGRRRPAQHATTSFDSVGALEKRVQELESQVKRLDDRAQPDALGVWFADRHVDGTEPRVEGPDPADARPIGRSLGHSALARRGSDARDSGAQPPPEGMGAIGNGDAGRERQGDAGGGADPVPGVGAADTGDDAAGPRSSSVPRRSAAPSGAGGAAMPPWSLDRSSDWSSLALLMDWSVD